MATQQKLNSLMERYTTEAEEMAAVKASLEEDLSCAHSELGKACRDRAEKERLLTAREEEEEKEREENTALKTRLECLGGVVGELEREKVEMAEEKRAVGSRLKEVTALMEVKGQRWAAEKTVLENRIAELGHELESVTDAMRDSLQEAEGRREREGARWSEEREGWLIRGALLEEQVKDLSRELETVEARSREKERETETLRAAVEEVESKADSLQVRLMWYSAIIKSLSLSHSLSLFLSLSLSLTLSLSLSLTLTLSLCVYRVKWWPGTQQWRLWSVSSPRHIRSVDVRERRGQGGSKLSLPSWRL